ncbi:MAG: UDP-N-acetylmuramate--alanine ligase [Candidatus Glassbacteria bacterium]|nr:UDP-N-acetylmuramate--alanine ligase [Candidatus Glassbacteria bacterium]
MEIDLERLNNIFFSGIAGSGMSALAQVLNQGGRKVSGSDRKFDRGESPGLKEKLASQGIRIAPQDGSGVAAGLDALVVSTAVEQDTPDYARATALGLAVIPRPALLAALVNSHRGLCFAGTSGKSTASALAAFVLSELGYSPNVITGAPLVNYQDGPTTGNALKGTGEVYCVEACESDGSVVSYRPAVGVILNIQRDHHEIPDLLPMFSTFAAACRETLVINADCPNLSRVELPGSIKTVRFGIESARAELRAGSLGLAPFGAAFRVGGLSLESPLPGRYNVYNVLAALAACEALGVQREDFARLLPLFRGVARRFQKVGKERGVTVIDDYAHNPDKVAAVLAAVKGWPRLRRLIAVFQPHGYGPTRFFFEDMVRTFTSLLGSDDLLVLPEIYYAGGTVARDISSRDLARRVSAAGLNALYFEDRREAVPVIAGAAGEGDVVLVMGARDDSLTDFCREVLQALKAGEN